MTDNRAIGDYVMNSPIPCLVFEADGMVVRWNGAAGSLFPRLAEASPDSIGDLVLDNADEGERIRFGYLLSSEAPFFSFDFAMSAEPDGETWSRLNVARQADGKYLALVEDITPQRLKETHLVQAKENAEKASVTRSQFLANISHEIRTPIQTIIGMMELLSDTKLDEEQTEYARQVRFSADVLLTLINDILDFSKGEAGQLKIENIEYDCSFVIERTIDLVSMEAHKKGLELIIDIDPELPSLIIGDPGRLQQIILNLVKNAVKFTNVGHILVRAVPIIKDDERSFALSLNRFIHFEIEDTGIGIDPKAQQGLFKEFFQADSSTTRKYGGSGLGLAICRNIVDLMGGDIGVGSNTPRGAVFWFDLPLIPAARQNSPPSVELPVSTRFLLVDDNSRALAVLVRILSTLGYRNVRLSESGAEALRTLHESRAAGEPIDIVFIDMVMPEMDGWRLAAEINKDREINQAQLYLMVPEGSFGAEAKMKLLEWFNGYLYKPIKRRLLADLLKDHYQSSIDLEVVEELVPIDDDAPEPDGAEIAFVETARSVEVIESTGGKEPKEDKEGTEEVRPAEGKTILVAEDHPVNRKLLTIVLEKAGAVVLAAADGQEAIELAGRHAIDMVFMDIQMPRKNGYEAAQWMRENGISCPIIACTASAQENEREQCLSVGMTDILPKPFKKTDVLAALAAWLGSPDEDGERESAAVFNYDELLDIMGGDADATRTLVGEYLDQTTSHVAILEEDIGKGDAVSAARTAHLIKGSSLNVTAGKLAQAARNVEIAAAESEAPRLLSSLEDLKREYARLSDALSRGGYAT